VSALLTLQEVKNFLRIDCDEDDALLSSLIITSRILVEDIIRSSIIEIETLPEPIKQAMFILIATLYEERQVFNAQKEGLNIIDTLDMVRKMLFAYRMEKF
jgi:uncharacterized phage protein (predicted DNA packaging)